MPISYRMRFSQLIVLPPHGLRVFDHDQHRKSLFRILGRSQTWLAFKMPSACPQIYIFRCFYSWLFAGA